MKSFILLAFLLSASQLHTQTWKFIGPDSASWRNVVQMDVKFRQGVQPRIGVATTKGIAANLSSKWKYVLPDESLAPIGPEYFYRTVFFSPWNDSVAFVGVDVIESTWGEPGSAGGVISNVHQDRWQSYVFGGGGWVGYVPSLAFVFSHHRQNRVYLWMPSSLYTTSNNGSNWERIHDNTYGCFFHAADVTLDSVLYASIRSNAIYRSTDDGTNWTSIYPYTFSFPRPHPYADFFANGDTLIWSLSRFPQTADSLCGIQVSIDRGATWRYVLRNLNVQKFVRDEGRRNIFYAAAEGGVYRSTNSGMSWSILFSNIPSSKLVDLRKDPYSDTLYVAARDSGVYKVADRTLEVVARAPLPVDFKLYQNYPNPFNPTTEIRYQIPNDGLVTLTVYDLLGREVATLVNEIQEAGYKSVTFDASAVHAGGQGLASGIYLCRMTAGEFVAARKIVLMK